MKNSKKLIALALAMLCVCSFSGCLTYSSNILEVTRPSQTTEPSRNYVPSTSPSYPTSTQPSQEETTTGFSIPSTEPASSVPASEVPTSVPPVTQTPTTDNQPTQPAAKDPTSMSKDELVQYVTAAVNKTRAFTGSVTAKHTDDFNIQLTKITGGEAVKAIANPILANLTKPANETLNYSGGKAKDSEGETIPLLLPKSGNFSLSAAQCQSITASKSGNNFVVKITLAPEKAGLGETPAANAGTAGFLDIASVDLPVTITALSISYSGTVLTYTINPNGYVAKASYHIPIAIEGSGKLKFPPISADLAAGGYEDEVFEFQW